MHVSGDHALLNWQRVLDEQSDWKAQVYFDQNQRHWPLYEMGENLNTVDIDGQYRFPLNNRNEVVCGIEFRNYQCQGWDNSAIGNYVPPLSTTNLYTCFIQDKWTLKEDLCFLTVGSKFERNDYTGFEWEPTIRLLLTPSPKYSLWGAISRSVLIPIEGVEDCRFMTAPVSVPPDSPLPVFPLIFGNPNQVPEEELSYEVGVRGQPTERFSWDLATFFNRYDCHDLRRRPWGSISDRDRPSFWTIRLRTAWSATPTVSSWPRPIRSPRLGDCKRPIPWCTWTCGRIDVLGAVRSDLPVPNNEFYLQSSFDLGRHWDLDLIGRYVDSIEAPVSTPKYIVGDVRLAWHPKDNLEVSVVGRNLLHGKFYQYNYDPVFGTVATEVGPEVYGQVAWRY